MSQTIIQGWIVFSGDFNPDPDAAAVALRRAGFHVTRMTARLRSRLAHLLHPLDDFMLVSIGGTITDEEKAVDAVSDELSAIANPYGGECFDCDVYPLNDAPSIETWLELGWAPLRHH
jgi:hypothetical protein